MRARPRSCWRRAHRAHLSPGEALPAHAAHTPPPLVSRRLLALRRRHDRDAPRVWKTPRSARVACHQKNRENASFLIIIPRHQKTGENAGFLVIIPRHESAPSFLLAPCTSSASQPRRSSSGPCCAHATPTSISASPGSSTTTRPRRSSRLEDSPFSSRGLPSEKPRKRQFPHHNSSPSENWRKRRFPRHNSSP